MDIPLGEKMGRTPALDVGPTGLGLRPLQYRGHEKLYRLLNTGWGGGEREIKKNV